MSNSNDYGGHSPRESKKTHEEHVLFFPKTGQGADPCSPFCHFVRPLWVNQMATRAARPAAAAVEENFPGEKKQACSPTNSTMTAMSVPDEAFKGDLESACSMYKVEKQ